MLKTIEPPFHESHKVPIDSLLDLLKKDHNFSLVSQVRARSTFFIASDDKGDMYGGAVLYPQKIPTSLAFQASYTLEEKFIKLSAFLHPKGEEFWGARIFICLKGEQSAAAVLVVQDMCHRFYQNLYWAFVAVGEQIGIKHLVYALRLTEPYHSKPFKSWPSQLGVALVNPKNDFIHGVLSLKEKPFKARRCPNVWREL